MARGWGRSEEDVGADKEQASEARRASSGGRANAERERRRRTLELTLSRIAENLAKTKNLARREALEAARAEVTAQLERL